MRWRCCWRRWSWGWRSPSNASGAARSTRPC